MTQKITKGTMEHKGYAATFGWVDAEGRYRGEVQNTLGVVAFAGKTPEEARRAFVEALDWYLRVLEKYARVHPLERMLDDADGANDTEDSADESGMTEEELGATWVRESDYPTIRVARDVARHLRDMRRQGASVEEMTAYKRSRARVWTVDDPQRGEVFERFLQDTPSP
jgi:predicted RNase H-like HicB family nuclease